MDTPFDNRILWWHWRGEAVQENTIDEVCKTIRTNTPNVTGIAIKTSNGSQWQGEFDDSKRALAIDNPDSITRWVETLKANDLETHAWCVVHGNDPKTEADRIIEACHVPGVRSMILDVEAGDHYFGTKPPEVARQLVSRVRADIPANYHLGLCLFVREDEPVRIHIDEWLPHVQSIHPMIYHWDFSSGTEGPRRFLDETFETLYPYNLPIVPILGTYPDPTTKKPVPEAHMLEAGRYALQLGAVGLSYFIFATAMDNCTGLAQYRAISQIDLVSH